MEKRGPVAISPEFQPDGRPSSVAARDKIDAAVLGENPVFEWVHRNAQGQDFPCEIRLSSLPAPRQHLVRFSVTDITDRRNAQQKLLNLNAELDERVHERTAELEQANSLLKESDLRLRRITDNMLDLVCQIDMAGNFEYVSPSYQAVLGYAPENLIGRNAFELVHLDDVACAMATLKTALQTGESQFLQLRFRNVEGLYRWMELTGKRLIDERGTAVGAVVSTRDVTLRKQGEQELQKASKAAEVASIAKGELLSTIAVEHAKLSAITESVPEILYMLSPAAQPVWWNRNLETVTGLAHDVIAQMSAFDFFCDADRLPLEEGLKHAAETGFASVKVHLRTLRGPVRYEFNSVPVKDVAGQILGEWLVRVET